jgi:hypothetical protein
LFEYLPLHWWFLIPLNNTFYDQISKLGIELVSCKIFFSQSIIPAQHFWLLGQLENFEVAFLKSVTGTPVTPAAHQYSFE